MSTNDDLEKNTTNGNEDDWQCPLCIKNTKGVSAKAARAIRQRTSIPFWWGYFNRGGEIQKAAAETLETHAVHVAVITLTILDLSFIITELVLFTFYASSEHIPHAVHVAEEVFAWLSVAILSIFSIEQLLKFLVFGPYYFITSLWHALDAVIIVTSLTLEILLRGPAREVVSLLVVFRLWRIIRIMHSIIEAMEISFDEKIEKHHQLETEMHVRILDLEKHLEKQEQQQTVLTSPSRDTHSNGSQ